MDRTAREPQIVHFAKYYKPYRGGMESVTEALARGAADAGREVAVVCFGAGPAADERLDGVTVARCPTLAAPLSQPLSARYVKRCLKAGRKADIVHVHAPNILATIAAIGLRRPKVLVHWHSDVVGKGIARRLVSPLEQRLLARADAVVATSDAYASSSPALAGHLAKLTSIPLGTPDWGTLAGILPAALPPDLSAFIGGRRLVLATGRLVGYKGFEVLVRAARDLDPAAAVLIVGSGPLHDPLSGLVRDLGVADRVRIVSGQPIEVLNALRAAARLFCLPSIYRSEAFGVVLIEAMTFGLPIVATRLEGSGVPWVNADGVSGLNVPVRDPVALAQACNRILGDDDLHRRLSEGSRRRWSELFREEAMVASFLRLYDRLSGDACATPAMRATKS